MVGTAQERLCPPASREFRLAAAIRRGFTDRVPDDLEIDIDLTTAQRGAERVRDMLRSLRQRFDLRPFEYSKQVRVAPTEIPYSHPRITLGTFVRDDLGLLSMFLHEQMHWYVTWYSHAHVREWQLIFARLHEQYPHVPTGEAGGAQDDFSTYLHLLVNWLEVEAVSRFIDRSQVVQHVRALPFYRWIYQTVIEDWEQLGALCREFGLLPIHHATEMSIDDLTLAARMDESPLT
jgi:hypothetical protein